MARYCCNRNNRKTLFRNILDSFTIESMSLDMSWIILETTFVQASLIKSHVFPLYKKQCSLQPCYIHTIAIYIPLSLTEFLCASQPHVYIIKEIIKESSEAETSGIWCITEDLTTLMKFPGYKSMFCSPANHVSFTLPNKWFQNFGQHLVQFGCLMLI